MHSFNKNLAPKVLLAQRDDEGNRRITQDTAGYRAVPHISRIQTQLIAILAIFCDTYAVFC